MAIAVDISNKFGPIRKGLLEFAVLKIISGHEVYAADILKDLSVTELATQEGTLYPLLSKLRREGLVDYKWVESDAGPPRKYYSLTTKAEIQLRDLEKYWQEINSTMSKFGSTPAEIINQQLKH